MPSRPVDPRIGIVVATRDRGVELRGTLERLVADGGAGRIVVVDDASRDDTAEVARSVGPPVEVVSLADNRGAAARTVGVEALDTPYVAFADDDSWWAPGALARAADLFDASPRLGLLNGRILVGSEERLDPTCAEMADSPLGRAADLPGPSLLGFVACGAVVRREAYLSVDGFAPWIHIGGEEELLALDLAAAGWGLAYVDDVVAHHHPSSLRDGEGRRRRVARNTVWVAWSRLPAGWALRRTAAVGREAAGDRAVASGVADALTGIAAVRRWRRVLPAPVLADLARLEAGRGLAPRPSAGR